VVVSKACERIWRVLFSCGYSSRTCGRPKAPCSRVGWLNNSNGSAVCAAEVNCHTNDKSFVSAHFGSRQHRHPNRLEQPGELMVDIATSVVVSLRLLRWCLVSIYLQAVLCATFATWSKSNLDGIWKFQHILILLFCHLPFWDRLFVLFGYLFLPIEGARPRTPFDLLRR